MTQINLLPWREGQREKQKKQFFIGLASSAVSALLLVVAVYFWLDGEIAGQAKRNQLVQVEISNFDQQIAEIKRLKKTRAGLIARMNIIQQLQENRPLAVHFFDELLNVLPQGVHFTEVKRNADIIAITGRTESNTGVSQLMRNIEKNFWLHNPVLEEIKEFNTGASRSASTSESVSKEFNLRILLKSEQSMKMAL